MSKHEWKPGDVGITGNDYGGEEPVLFVVGDDGRFAYADGQVLNWPPRSDARPLVVIDPEDREQVERLDNLYWRTVDPDTAHASMQAALREYANPQPPKPDEPQGLGAVVEDENGRLWANMTDPICTTHTDPWVSVHDPDRWASYGGIAAVRVLSEGVVV